MFKLFGKKEKKSVVKESISPEEIAEKFSEICEDTHVLIQEALDRNEEMMERAEFIVGMTKIQLELLANKKVLDRMVEKSEQEEVETNAKEIS